MKLRVKSIIISIVLSISFVFFALYFVDTTLTAKFQELENQRVGRDLSTINYVIEDQFKQINSKLTDWASWDDTYKFIDDKNKAYIESNMSVGTFAVMGIDRVIFVNSNNEFVLRFSSDVGVVEDPQEEGDFWTFFENNRLLAIDSTLGYGKGILRTKKGLAMYVVRDILKSDETGEKKGKLVFAKYIDNVLLDKIKSITQFEVMIKDWNESDISSDFSIVKSEMGLTKNTMIRILNNDVNAGYYKINDVFNVPQAIIRIEVIRDIFIQGKQSILLLAQVLTVFGMLMVLSFNLLLNKLVIKKIFLVSEEVSGLANSGKFVKRLTETRGNDEIDKLRLKINEMLDLMQTAQIAIENSSNHVVITDIDGKILFANKAAEKMTGFAATQMNGNTPRLWGGQMSLEFYKDLWKTIKVDKNVFSGEIINKRSNGEIYTALATITPVLSEEGELKAFVGVEEDISDRKKNDMDREETLERLKKLNRLMTGRELKMVELKNTIEKLKNDSKN